METNMHTKKERVIEQFHHLQEDAKIQADKYQHNVLERFPFIFLGLSTFGAVMIFYGFEKIIDHIPFLHDKPIAMVILGFLILIITGALYRKL